jgi:hypothetical protein
MMKLNRREFLRLSSSVAAALLAMRTSAQPLKRRKEIRALGAAEIDTLRSGIQAMKDLPRSNPFSWQYQRAVHDAPLATASNPDPAGVAPYWRRCEHGSVHFFSWHRWQLLYWEEIARQLSGAASFTLPYWDYIRDPYLPEPFRTPPAGQQNTLNDNTRVAALNNGTAHLNTIAEAFDAPSVAADGLDQIDFFSFQVAHEGNPHDLVHGLIGGNMGDVLTSAQDPIFWLHHCNIDRYWEVWLKQGNGRANPSQASWRSRPFQFQTVSGAKTVTAGDAVDIGTLGYTYDAPIKKPPVPDIVKFLNQIHKEYRFPRPKVLPPKPKPPGPGPFAVLSASSGISITGQPSVIPVPRAPKPAATLSKALSDAKTELVLTLKNIRISEAARAGGFGIHVYLVPSEKDLAAGKAQDAVQIGSFSTFTVSVARQHVAQGHSTTPDVSLQLNAQAKALLSRSLDTNPAIVFLRRGLADKSGQLKHDAAQELFSVEEIRLEARRPQ